MISSESQIKQALDGWFLKYQPYLDVFKMIEVPIDFIPAHENVAEMISAKAIAAWRANPTRKMGRNKKIFATSSQTQEIKEWQARGHTISAIHKRMRARGDKISERAVADVMRGEK